MSTNIELPADVEELKKLVLTLQKSVRKGGHVLSVIHNALACFNHPKVPERRDLVVLVLTFHKSA